MLVFFPYWAHSPTKFSISGSNWFFFETCWFLNSKVSFLTLLQILISFFVILEFYCSSLAWNQTSNRIISDLTPVPTLPLMSSGAARALRRRARRQPNPIRYIAAAPAAAPLTRRRCPCRPRDAGRRALSAADSAPSPTRRPHPVLVTSVAAAPAGEAASHEPRDNVPFSCPDHASGFGIGRWVITA